MSEYNSEQEDSENFAFGIVFYMFLMMILIGFFCALLSEKTPKGYGGSPGHMSPMEVEALYEKNKK